jgi:hypothetical protein
MTRTNRSARKPVNNVSCENRRMAELPELRNIANINGGSAMTFSDCQRTNSSEGIFVMGSDTFSEQAGLLRKEAAVTSNGSGSESEQRSDSRRRSPAWSRAAQWASLDPDERAVFHVWAKSVAAFYSLLVVSLLTATLLGVHALAGPTALPLSAALEQGSAGLSVPRAGSIGK